MWDSHLLVGVLYLKKRKKIRGCFIRWVEVYVRSGLFGRVLAVG